MSSALRARPGTAPGLGTTVRLLVFLGATAVPASAARLPFKSYTTAEGLPHEEVRCVVQGSHGFLWFCTGEGLSLFDGYRFTTFGVEAGLPSPMVNAFVEADPGEYWIATAAGLCRFEARTSRGSAADGAEPGSRWVRALLKDSEGRVWAGTEDGLYRAAAASRRFERVNLGTQVPDPDVFSLAQGP